MNKYNYSLNTKYLFLEKVIRLSLSFVVSIWIANFLGPNNFGLLNYAISFTLLFASLLTLGLDKYIPREIILNYEDENKILSSAIFLRLFGGIIMLLVVNTISYAFQNEDNVFRLLVCIISFGYIFRTFDVLRYWFEAHVISKYSMLAQSISLLAASSIKIILILVNSPVEYFAYGIITEYIVQSILLVSLFIKFKSISNIFIFSYEEMLRTLKNTWPLLLSSLLHDIYSKVDIVMLGQITSSHAVGIYTAATKISLAWLFIPTVIATSFFPKLLHAKKESNHDEYFSQSIQIMSFILYLGICITATTFFFSETIIDLLYTRSYAAASAVLNIHIFGTIFIGISSVTNRVFVAENLNTAILYRAIAGFSLNIVLNYILIPMYGAVGAAIATTSSLFISLFLINSLTRKTRTIFRMQLSSINPVYLGKIYTAIRNRK